MNENWKSMSRQTLLALLLLATLSTVVITPAGQRGANESETGTSAQWEYLVVSGASSINLSSPSNPRLRKESTEAFGHESFVLEQHLDKLGAKGWELVAVTGPPQDPTYFFKRQK